MQKSIVYFFCFFIFFTSLFSEERKKFLMLKNNKTNVRYGPGFDYPIKFIYKKNNLPLQVIDKKENFRKIIDHKKNNGWIHISQLRKSKSLIATSNKVLFKKPTKYSKPIAKIEKGRLLIVIKCEEKWCKVSSQNYSGWIKTENVWGKN